MSDKKRKDRKLSHWLKVKLGSPAPMEYQDVQLMAEGEPQKLIGEVIADNIAREAMKGERWAIELSYDRTEGKPIQAVKEDTGERSVEERIEDVTKHHLNELAKQFGGSDVAAEPADGELADALAVDPVKPRATDRGRDQRDGEARDDGPGTVRGILDLPRDGDNDPEDGQG